MSDQAPAGFVTPMFPGTAAATSLLPAAGSSAGLVGICLSGGGSRAMGAAMGQLQALEMLMSGGTSLLSQVAAISTVSGGGWIGIPFTYLPSGFSDAEFLGSYTEPASLTVDIIRNAPAGWIGGKVSDGFSIAALAVAAIYLKTKSVPENMLWQTLMGLTFLTPYGLFPASSANYQPASLFSLDEDSLQSDVTGPNPTLADVPAYLVAAETRPYLLSVASMFVDYTDPAAPENGTVPMLAPVQSTPFATGVFPVPAGASDVAGQSVGGGAVASFAFDSVFESAESDEATVQQGSQWSLMDILGTSSAAFAATLESQIDQWSQSPERLAAALRLHKDPVAAKLGQAGLVAADVATTLETIASAAESGGLDAAKTQLGGLAVLTGLVPQYDYWSPAFLPPGGTVKQQAFADGGSLDNTGVTSMLLYPDITKIIAFVNTENALRPDKKGNLIVDASIAALFGYQAYDKHATPAYAPSSKAPAKDLQRLNQIFPSADFQPLLEGLWQSTGGNESLAPVFSQNLVTVENDWFRIPAGRAVTVLWVYLGMSQTWRGEITDDLVRLALDAELVGQHFPYYDTLKTERSPTQMHFLSNLTAWTLLQNSAAVTAVFDA